MTKFSLMDSNPIKDKTTFNRFLSASLEIEDTIAKPSIFDNVKFLFSDLYYGDVFIAWDNDEPEDKTLYFGKKGSEFDNL